MDCRSFIILVIMWTCCAASSREPAGSPSGSASRRLLQSGSALTVTVSTGTQDPNPPLLSPKLMGTYRSEEMLSYDKIYDPEKTLKPLNLASTRIQLRLQDDELDAQGNFVDSNGTQLGTLRLAAASTPELFITVGFPQSTNAKAFLAADYSTLLPGWEAFWNRTYTTVAAKIAQANLKSMIYIEILGEPDVSVWSYVYSSDQAKIFKAIQIAYKAFSQYRTFKVGGCGFAFPEGQWFKDFLNFYKANSLKFQFFSWHTFLGWADATNPADYPWGTTGVWNIQWRNRQFMSAIANAGILLAGKEVIISELGWQHPDLTTAAGFSSAPAGLEPPGGLSASQAGSRYSLTHHQSCARTLQTIKIVLAETTISRAFWSQGVGNSFFWFLFLNQPYLYSYLPIVVYDPASFANPDGETWRYKASYYAFWIYGRLTGTRRKVTLSQSASWLSVWATRTGNTVRVVLWNRSNADRAVGAVRLALNGVTSPAARACTMYLIDATTYGPAPGTEEVYWVIREPMSQLPPVVPGVATIQDVLNWFVNNPLRAEATVFIDIPAIA